MSCNRHRFPTWGDALHSVLHSTPGPAFDIRWCDACHAWHLFIRALRYAHR